MRTAIAGGFALLLIGIVVAAYLQGRSDGFAAHEVAAQAKALEVQKEARETAERLHGEVKAELGETRAEAENEIAAIRAAESKAQAEADAHAARAANAEATADRALAMADELQSAAIPACPVLKPGDPCDFLCTLPDVPG